MTTRFQIGWLSTSMLWCGMRIVANIFYRADTVPRISSCAYAVDCDFYYSIL